jgi:DNA-binding IclR family transcriptional regulator
MYYPSPPKGAQAAIKAVRLLKLFSIEKPKLSLEELTKMSGLSKNTTHRPLCALQSEGLIERDCGAGGYILGAGIMALGVQALASSDLRRRIRPMLKLLARNSGETATLKVLVGDSMLILDEVFGHEAVGTAGDVGTRWPLHATATGKATLAFDEECLHRLVEPLAAFTSHTLVSRTSLQAAVLNIRRCGYAESVDELEEGFTAVGTVIRDPLGGVQGALSIGGPTRRLTSERRLELGRMLRKAATALSPGLQQ